MGETREPEIVRPEGAEEWTAERKAIAEGYRRKRFDRDDRSALLRALRSMDREDEGGRG